MISKTKILPLLIVAAFSLCACSASQNSDNDAPVQQPAADTAPAPEITVDRTDVDTETAPETENEVTEDTQLQEPAADGDEPSSEETADTGDNADAQDDADKDPEDAGTKTGSGQPVVWLGDSLTQGSLGDDNDNLANAPFEKLKKMVDVPVEGYGLYGFNTGEIFWTYTDENHINQKRDANKTYVFWVGSNDWVKDGVPNTDTTEVISRIDDFLNRNGVVIKNYIVLGTTARYELGDSYKVINAALAQHYGSHYLDVIDVIGPNGYVDDRIHLTQAAYDAVAKAVAGKLKSLGYI